MQILTRDLCQPCEGRGTLPAPQQALRVVCGACDGKGYREQWRDAGDVARAFSPPISAPKPPATARKKR